MTAENKASQKLMPLVLCLCLAIILFRIPEPAIRVNLPFKAELVLSAFVIALLLMTVRRRSATNFSSEGRILMLTGATFMIWSGLSYFWGSAIGPVAHHTLLWGIYYVFFATVYLRLREDAGATFILTTFAAVTLLVGLLCLFDYISIRDFAAGEGSLRIRYGRYAEMLVCISPVLWATAAYARSKVRFAASAAMASLAWLTVMLSLSKGAFLAGIIASTVFFVGCLVLSRSGFRRRIAVLAGIWLALTIGTQTTFSIGSSVPSTTDYLSGTADPTRSTTAMRLFTWSVARQMAADNWLAGVGADSFGVAFNDSRADFRRHSPEVPADEIAEDYLVERAHNEPLQILAELGVIGFALFAMPFAIFAFWCFRTVIFRRGRMSPILIGCVSGMIGFAASSMVSSFSFRSAQNGVAFFMVLALATNEIGNRKRNAGQRSIAPSISVLAIAIPLAMLALCLTKVYAEYCVYSAEGSVSSPDAYTHLDAAIAVDPEYAGAHLLYGFRLAADNEHIAAAVHIRKAVSYGIGTTPVYAKLAREYEAAGQMEAAETTFLEGLGIYPRSVYLRVEFAVFLERAGRSGDAVHHFSLAREIDGVQTNGWRALILDGSTAAFYKARNDRGFATPADLRPESAVRQYLDAVPGH